MLDRYVLAGDRFARTLRAVGGDQWDWPTPCPDWTVRQLVNHMTRGNLNYAALLRGGTAGEFLRLRDADALGTDPHAAYGESVALLCATACAETGALERVLDYPLGKITGRQALDVRTTDSLIHTWDLATAVHADDQLDPGLVAWVDDHLDEIYAGLPETPVSADTTHRFFAAPHGVLPADAARQARLLHRMGRTSRTG